MPEIVIRLRLPGRPGKRWLWVAAAAIVCFGTLVYALDYTTPFANGEALSSSKLNSYLKDLNSRVATLESPNSTRVYASAAQSIPNNTDTPLSFNMVRYDYGSQWSNSTPTRLTAKVAGVYEVGVCLEYLFAASGSRDVEIRWNGTTIIASQVLPQNGVNTPSQCINTIYSLAQNDYVEAIATQISGSSLNINSTSSYSPEFWMHRLR